LPVSSSLCQNVNACVFCCSLIEARLVTNSGGRRPASSSFLGLPLWNVKE
jgi:hypothetical protein